MVEEALVVYVDLPQGPLAQPVRLGDHALLEVVHEVPRPDTLKLLLEPATYVMEEEEREEEDEEREEREEREGEEDRGEEEKEGEKKKEEEEEPV